MSLEGFKPVVTAPACPQCGQPMQGPTPVNILNLESNGQAWTCPVCAWTRTEHATWRTPRWRLDLDRQAFNSLQSADLGNTAAAIAYMIGYRTAWNAALTLTQNLEERL